MALSLRWAVNCSTWAPSKEEWLKALSIIQKEEIKRVGQFVFQRDAKFALVGRLLIRAGISEYMGGACNLTRHHLGRNERGKPVLLDASDCEDRCVSFNISHQGDYAVLAMEKEGLVGVDIMQLSQPRNTSLQQFFHTMRRQFTVAEWAHMAPPSSSPHQQLSNFYRLWSLKESFIKAEGSGLSYGLQNLEFVCGPGWPPPSDVCCTGSQLYIRGDLAKDWKFEESILDDHCVSVAVYPVTCASTECPTFTLLTAQCLLSKLQPSELLAPTLTEHWEEFQKKKCNPSP